MSFFRELQRRNVFRVAVAYGVVAWLLIQVGATLEPAMHLPEWTDSILAFFLLLGFPVALFLSWAYELTPDGLKRDDGIEPGDSTRTQAGRKWDRMISIVLALALAYFLFDKYLLDAPEEESSQTVTSEIEEAASPTSPAVTESSIPQKSIAVLPFVNMSSDPEQEYFSDGLTEELLNLLADISELKVAARTSSFYYKNKLEEITMREIAQQLEVAHILEGSVRRDGNQIRITAQLIKADDGFHLWSETYDRTLDSIFAIQDEIAAVVVDELKITLLGEVPHARVVNTESLDLTMEARFLFNRRQEGDWQKAFENLKRAVELDPENADAWTWLSPLYIYVGDDEDQAWAAIDTALELEPGNADALMRKALLLDWMGKQEEAIATQALALEAGPNNTFVLRMVGWYEQNEGNIALALDYYLRAVVLDPLDLTSIANLTDLLAQTGQLDEAEKYALRGVEVSPFSPVSNMSLIKVLLRQGRAEEALELTIYLPDDFVEYATGIPRLQASAMAYHTMGDQANADAALEEFKDRAGDQVPVDVAMIHAWRGETDEAFKWIDRALAADPDSLIVFIRRGIWDNIKDDPRWAEVMARIDE